MESMITIDNDIRVYPGRLMYIDSIRSLVAADLHLGIEYAMALKGVFLPAFQFEEIRNVLLTYIKRLNPKALIIVGDLKHEFGTRTRQEHRETIKLLEEMMSLGLHFVLVRGNHDNFIRGVLEKFEVDFRDPIYVVGKYLFIHGHKDIPESGDLTNIKYIIMGHEHPAVLFRDEVGGKGKVPIFLFGRYNVQGVKLIVLPALSPIATGVEVNIVDRSELLSPILRRVDIDNFRAIGCIGNKLLEFPEVRYLRFGVY